MKVGIVGTSGYSGGELLRLLATHPKVTVAYVASTSRVGQSLTDHFPALAGFYDLQFERVDPKAIAQVCDVVFTATPHGVAMNLAADLLAHETVLIDIGADFRFRDATVFETWYQTNHIEPELAAEAVYGLPEMFRDELKKARLIANPGCYPTSALLALAPLVKENIIDMDSIHIASMSGVSGAGATPKPMYHFPHCVENVQAYGIPGHRHTAEIEQGLGFLLGEPVPPITFAPHLVPMSRGILTHATAKAKGNHSRDELYELYRDYYRDEPFVRVLHDRLPYTKAVAGSNFCDVAPVFDERTGRVTVVSAIDNLVKGASGQAIQNMNIRFGFDESLGLSHPGIIP